MGSMLINEHQQVMSTCEVRAKIVIQLQVCIKKSYKHEAMLIFTSSTHIHPPLLFQSMRQAMNLLST